MLRVEREGYLKNEKSYWAYVIKGKVRGKDIKVKVVPPDIDGYQLLDIVFGDENSAQLVLTPYEIKDEKTGEVKTGNTYTAVNVDAETGKIYECPIKPFKKTDKTALQMLLDA